MESIETYSLKKIPKRLKRKASSIKRFYSWHSSESQTGRLKDILSDSKGRDLFFQFLKSEHAEENLQFWIQVQDYNALSQVLDDDDLLSKAKLIFSQYVDSGSNMEVNLPDGIRQELIQRFQQATTETIGIDTFNKAQNSVLDMLSSDSYRRFLLSDWYQEYYQEILESSKELNKKLISI